MTALSIVVPDDLARDSLLIAKRLHISRSQFIRLAIENEIKAYKLAKEQQDMLVGFKAVKDNLDYLEDIEKLEQLDVILKNEGESWWKD